MLPEGIPDPECASGIGKGWWPVVSATHKAMLAVEPNYTIAQIKEKFGGLRYYWDMPYLQGEDLDPEEDREWQRKHDILQALADLAESICAHICETCGRASEVSCDKYWYRNICEECRKP